MENNILIVNGSYTEKRIGTARNLLDYAIDVFKSDLLELGMHSDETEDDLQLVNELASLVREDADQLCSLEWSDFADHYLVVLKPWDELPKHSPDVIHDNENIIGFTWDIIREVENNLEREDESDREISKQLLKDLNSHYGLVKCCYHPTGTYTVYDLYTEKENS